MYNIQKLLFLSCFILIIVPENGALRPGPSCLEGDGSRTLFSYEDDSPLYWECWNGIRTLKTCSEGLIFDGTIQKCVVPDSYLPSEGDPRCKNVTIDFFPDLTDCSRYIECYNGDSYLMACRPGLWFNAKEKICVEPELSGCSTDYTPIPTLICTDVPDDKIVLKKCTCGCSFYWMCKGKSQSLEVCPYIDYYKNGVFDEERQLCSVAANDDCSSITNTPYTPAAWTPTPDKSQTPPSYDDPRCKNQRGIFLAHPFDCAKYIECLDTWSHEWDCPRGLYFDSRLQKCVVSQDTNCVYSDPRCKFGLYGTFWYPHDCSKYIQCYNGNTYLVTCPDDKLYSDYQKQCVFPEDSDCGSTTTPRTTTTPITRTTLTTLHTTVDPLYVCYDVPRGKREVKRTLYSCSMYYHCNGPDQTLRHCRNDDQSDELSPLYFDPLKRLCGATVDCNDVTATPFPYTTSPTIAPTLPDFEDPRCQNYTSFGDWTFWSHPQDCRKFVECYSGPHGDKGYERDCPEGFYFSSKDKACVLPEDSDCI